jgi:cobalt/nickel transport system permease protein
MHIAEGVLSSPVLLVSAVLAVAGTARGLAQLRESQLPLAALLGAAFFVAGTLHVPVGVGSVHLVLNGIAGLMLGVAVFPVMLVALFLQVVMFSFGGFSVLGANLLAMAVPALLAHALLRARLPAGTAADAGSKARWMLLGALAGIIGIVGSALIAAGLLALSGGRDYQALAMLLVAAHLPVLVADAAIGAAALWFLARMVPQALPGRAHSVT